MRDCEYRTTPTDRLSIMYDTAFFFVADKS
jgi:hypothetical protein